MPTLYDSAANALDRLAELTRRRQSIRMATDGPREGDVNADGLRFHNHRWHNDDESSTGPESSPQHKLPKRRETKFTFSKPIFGPSGVAMIGYEWRYEMYEEPDHRGELRIRRISNWDESEVSDDTGRQIVHLFTVKDKDGAARLLSLESAIYAMGYAEKSDAKQISTIAHALKKRALAQMELAHNQAMPEFKRTQLTALVEALDDKIEKLNKLASDPDNSPDARREWVRKASRMASHLKDRDRVIERGMKDRRDQMDWSQLGSVPTGPSTPEAARGTAGSGITS